MASHSKVQYYAPRQIIFRGQQSDIDNLIDQLQTTYHVTLKAVRSLDLSVLPPHTAGEVLVLYEISGALAAEEVLVHVLGLGTSVVPSLNYFIGRPPIPTAGDPWGVEGSPWGVEGSPDTDSLPAAQNDFLTQWALGPQGIQLCDDNGSRTASRVGTGVCVGIFDTSPFPEGDVAIDWAPAIPQCSPLTLHVEHPETFYQMPPLLGAPDISGHGLFVAGLVYAVAPASRIHLIRVLDEFGQGDAFTLAAAVLEFTVRMIAARANNQVDGAVVNLSLGIPLDAPMVSNGYDLEDCVSEIARRIARSDILVAAAAGNDSWALPISQIKSAQLPARDDLIIGVQASNIGGARACFSNRGDIAAPGCGLLSLAIKDPSDNPCGYAYWAGTSFATPLVSGLAALMLEHDNWDLGAVVNNMHQAATASSDATLPEGIATIPDGL